MHFFTFAEKDTTLYQNSGSLNAGMDEILEIRKEVSATGESVNVSRILIRFDINEISSSIVGGRITKPSFFLNLYDAKSEKTILWNDEKIGIDWPINTKPVLSEKDDFK